MNVPEEAQVPEAGRLARDVLRNRVGVVMARTYGHVWLRPRGGGREWTVPAENVEPVERYAEAAATLHARVADANRRSRGEW